MNTWKVIFATAVIFIAGALTGGLLVHNFSPAHLPDSKLVENGHNSNQSTNTTRQPIPPPLMGPFRKDFVDRLQRELKIDAAQRERIEKNICEGQELTRNIWLEIEPDIYQTIVDTKDKIRAELTVEQQAKFEELFKPKPKNPATNAPVSAITNPPALKL